MSLGGFLFVLLAAWCTIYISYFSRKPQSSFLPSVNTAIGQESPSGAGVTLNGLHVRISTTRLNAYHDKIITFFARRRNQKITTRLITLYNFGVLLGALGMTFVMLFCLMGLGDALRHRLTARGSTLPASNLFRRLIEATQYPPKSLPPRNRFPIVTPIVNESSYHLL
jgi:hypothetical protein